MGLDLYVGSLTRYYSREWETVVQKWGREHGMQVKVLFAANGVHPTWEEIEESVLAWRDDLSEALALQGFPGLSWTELPEMPYFTNKPDWRGYHGLLAWAAHDDHPHIPLPETLPRPLDGYEAYALSQRPHGTRYPHMVTGVDIWLPADFSIVFETITPIVKQARFGSVHALHRELLELNERTWKIPVEEMDAIASAGTPARATVEEDARLGLCLFHRLTSRAMEYELPLVLDA